MEDLLLQLVDQTSGVFSYGIVFLVLLLCGLGVPLPEDISLILGGYLVHDGKAQLLLMMLTGFTGILMGDSIIFFAGRRIGSQIGNKPQGFFAGIVTPAKRARVEGLFHNHGEKIVMLARFMPGVRAVSFFTAGSVRMKYSHFIFFDGLAALVSAPVFVFLGFRFGGELETLIDNVRKGQTRVVVGLAVAIVSYIGYLIWKNRREKAQAAAEKAALSALAAGTEIRSPSPSPVAAPNLPPDKVGL